MNIITRSRPRNLSILLFSLLKQTHRLFDIVLVNDGDPLTEQNLRLLNRFRHKLINNKEHLGIPKSRNLALSFSKAQFIFRIDDDHYCEADCIERLYKVLQISPKIGGVGCTMPFITKDLVEVIPNKDNSRLLNSDFSVNSETEKDSLYLYESNSLIYTDVLRGCFLYRNLKGLTYCEDLSKIGHGEETLFSYQLAKKGYQLCINPWAIAWHLYGDEGGCRNWTEENSAQIRKRDSQILLSNLKEL